jgi:hypothetical protein
MKPLGLDVRLKGPVTTSGWYRTVDFRFAFVAWVDGQPVVSRVVDRLPTPEEEDQDLKNEALELYEAHQRGEFLK